MAEVTIRDAWLNDGIYNAGTYSRYTTFDNVSGDLARVRLQNTNTRRSVIITARNVQTGATDQFIRDPSTDQTVSFPGKRYNYFEWTIQDGWLPGEMRDLP